MLVSVVLVGPAGASHGPDVEVCRKSSSATSPGQIFTITSNIWISVITLIISCFAAYSGSMISVFFSRKLSSAIGMLFLTGIGLWMILGQYMTKTEEPEQEKNRSVFGIMKKPENADMDDSAHIDFKEATFLGVALSINNVGGGMSAGIIGLNPLWVGFLSAVLNFVALWAGNYIAEVFVRWHLSQRATVVAGMILIAIGIEQVM